MKIKRGQINEIAKTIGVTHSAVSQWFAGKTTPNIKAAAIIEDKFKIPIRAWVNIMSYLESGKENR